MTEAEPKIKSRRRLPKPPRPVGAIARIVGAGVLTLFVISLVTFLGTNAIPSDPARLALGRLATPQELALYRKEQNLDKPVVTRYVDWLGNFVKGDWGTSTVNRLPVSETVDPRIARSAILAFSSVFIALVLSLILGVYTGKRSGKKLDLGVSMGTLFLNALPEFVIGIFVLVILGVVFQVFPIESSDAVLSSGTREVKAYAMPIITLSLVLTPYFTRMIRVNVREVTEQPFVRSAVLRGLSSQRITWRHVVPNASLPVISVVALSAAELIAGLVVVEAVFGFPGIGQALVDAVLGGDIPIVQVVTILVGVGFVVINMTADLVMVGVDPRLRKASE
jgi:peptide/nickel transport system permease protein